MSEPSRQFRDDHRFKTEPPVQQPEVPVPGRGTLVATGPASVEGLVAQQLRSALGALAQLKTRWIPALDAATTAQHPDEIAVLNARSALLRAEAAMAQAGGLMEKVKSPELDHLFQAATTERESVAPQVLELFVAHDNLPEIPADLFGGPIALQAGPDPGPGSGGPVVNAPAKTPVDAPAKTPPVKAPPPPQPPVVAKAAPGYAPTWADIQKAAAGDAAALKLLDVDWIDKLHWLVVTGVDGVFKKSKTDGTYAEVAKGITSKSDRELAVATKKLTDDRIKELKADKLKPPSKDDLKLDNIKKDPEVIKKQAALEKQYADSKAAALAKARAEHDTARHKIDRSQQHKDVVDKVPDDKVTNEEGRLLARANFMSWGIHLLGSAAALKAHYTGLEDMPRIGRGYPVLMTKAAATRLNLALDHFEKTYPGNTFFETTVAFGLRDAQHQEHGMGYMGHALGLSIDFQAVRNPSFLNLGGKDGGVTRFMLKKFGGKDVGGKHVDGTVHMEMGGDVKKVYAEILAMGEASAKGEAVSATGQKTLDAAVVAYGKVTETSDNFRASQAKHMTALVAAKKAWVELHGTLPVEQAGAKAKFDSARNAAGKRLAKEKSSDAGFKAMNKTQRDTLVADEIKKDAAVIETGKALDEITAKMAAHTATVKATIETAFTPWIKQLEGDIAEIEKVSEADKALAADTSLVTAATYAVTRAAKRADLDKILDTAKYAPLFDVFALKKIADVAQLKAAMSARLTYLKKKSPSWLKNETAIYRLLIAKLQSGAGVFGKVEKNRRGVWDTKAYVNSPPVMQLLEIGFASHDTMAPAQVPGKKPKEVFNLEFIQTMMRFGFAPLTMWEEYVDTMHFDFLEGFNSLPHDGFFTDGTFGPKP